MKKFIFTTDVDKWKESGLDTIRKWYINPESDGYLWRGILEPIVKSGFDIEFMSIDDYAKANPHEYAFAFIFAKKFNNIPRWKGKMIAYVHDAHNVQNYDLTGFDAVFSAYKQYTEAFHQEKTGRKISIPHFWCPNIFNPKWATKTYSWRDKSKTLVTGTIHKTYYPERYQLNEQLRSRPIKRLYYQVNLSNAPGYQLVHNQDIKKLGRNWIYYLSKFKTVCFAKDKWGYFVKKYTEIPAAGSLMLAPKILECETANLVDKYNYIALDVDNIWSQLDWIKSNPKRAKIIRDNGISWVEEFTKKFYEETLNDYLEQIL